MSDITRDYSFGGWIKHYRIKNKFTLRQAAELSGIDVGNLSKLERSQMAPPSTRERVESMLDNLGVEESHHELLISIAMSFHLGKVHERFRGGTADL